MDTDRIQILHITNCNTGTISITHYFVFDLFPACDTTLYQNLTDTAESQTIHQNLDKLFFILSDTTAASAEGVCRTEYNRISNLLNKFETGFYRCNNLRWCYRLMDFLHGFLEFQSVLCFFDC